jgi:phospholipid/cholesterol/gamma-HCH transport system substrate-binding protein
MNEYRRNVSVGLFILFGLLGVAALIILYGELPEFLQADTYRVTLRFSSLTGVQVGTPVNMRGLRVGKVDKVGFRDPRHPEQGLDVRVKIEKQYAIPSTAVAVVAPQAIGFSRPEVELTIGRGPAEQLVPQDGSGILEGKLLGPFESLIPPETAASLEGMVTNIGRLATALTPVADDLHKMLEHRPLADVDNPPPGHEPAQGNLSTAAARLDRALKHFNIILGDPDNQSNIKITLDNFKRISEEGKAAAAELKGFAENARSAAADFKGMAGKLNTTIDSTSAQLDRVFRVLIDDADKLGRFLDHLNKAGHDMAEGDGTIGRLLRDPKLYEELTLTAQRLTEAIKNLDFLLKKWREEGVNVQGLFGS